jgi:hypothetical protein
MLPPEKSGWTGHAPEFLEKMNHSRRKTPLLPLLAVLLCLTAGGCVSSTEPILTDGRGIIGEGGQIHLFDVQDGANRNPRIYQFQLAGKRYAVRGRPVEISDFTVHPYEGRDLIVQARAQQPLRPYFYGLARKLADGVYFVTAIDPNDADQPTRDRFCIKTRDAPCRIETPEQLFVFARASAAKESEQGKLAVLVRPAPAPTVKRR